MRPDFLLLLYLHKTNQHYNIFQKIFIPTVRQVLHHLEEFPIQRLSIHLDRDTEIRHKCVQVRARHATISTTTLVLRCMSP